MVSIQPDVLHIGDAVRVRTKTEILLALDKDPWRISKEVRKNILRDEVPFSFSKAMYKLHKYRLVVKSIIPGRTYLSSEVKLMCPDTKREILSPYRFSPIMIKRIFRPLKFNRKVYRNILLDPIYQKASIKKITKLL